MLPIVFQSFKLILTKEGDLWLGKFSNQKVDVDKILDCNKQRVKERGIMGQTLLYY